MNIRKLVIRQLRKYGAALVATVHDRLTTLESKLEQLSSHVNELNTQNEDLAASHTALLQGSIHVIEAVQKLRETCYGQTDLLVRLEAPTRELRAELAELSAQAKAAAGSQQTLVRSCMGGQRQALEAVTNLKDQLARALENEVVQQVCVETSDYSLANPEIGLMSFLYSYLPTRQVIDIGAHAGDVSEALLDAGYEVYAFEPSSAVYNRLVNRLRNRDDFHSFEFALGSKEGEMPLHSATDVTSSNMYGDTTVFSSLVSHSMPDGLRFTECTNVWVRTLESVHRAGLVPADAGLVKIDTEGFDLEVIRGMGEHRYPVVATEYWDRECPFGQSDLLYTLESIVAEMKCRGYFWYVVLYRLWGRNQIGYYCNYNRSLSNSWGNVFFFRTYELFAQAQMWCSGVLPRTYFKPSLAVVAASRVECLEKQNQSEGDHSVGV
jgi:FkbM family methyltransferase